MKLMLTDIDGTILPWGHEAVSERTRAAFRAAQAAGHVAGLATGRGYSWLPRFFAGEGACYATAVATNGMQIYHAGELICEKTLPVETLEHMAAVVREYPQAGMLCFEGARPLLVAGARDDLAPLFPAYAETCEEAPVPQTSVVKANVYIGGGEAAHKALVEALNREVPELHTDLARPGFSNVMLAGWNKGAAVLYLRDYLGIAPEDVFVFGDAGNDLPMFEVVENSVAMGNATPEAAAAAHWHIGNVEDDACAQAIEALARGKFPFTE